MMKGILFMIWINLCAAHNPSRYSRWAFTKLSVGNFELNSRRQNIFKSVAKINQMDCDYLLNEDSMEKKKIRIFLKDRIEKRRNLGAGNKCKNNENHTDKECLIMHHWNWIQIEKEMCFRSTQLNFCFFSPFFLPIFLSIKAIN